MSSLEACEVTECFGGLVALNRISCIVKLSQIAGLVGSNGGGKTGTLNALSDLCSLLLHQASW
jgi:ABC-type branched-subunit amino acid transport system ATPase component